MAAAHAVYCELLPPRQTPRVAADSSSSSGQVKIILQPRLCTLRSYASDRGNGVIKTMIITKSKDSSSGVDDGTDEEELLSPFLVNLYEYIESSKKSQDFEIITGRLAMIVFAATIGVELTTGNSVFKKMDVQGISEGLGACLAAITAATAFAYSSSARKKVGRIFTVSCNAFIDTLIDNIVDGLFYENEEDDQSNDNNL
ncbi:stress enhanced protein 2, chloroplastic [Beta vulgaris subsp. vulgaris]|uniref:stress enhanced protein 2, chloroplastic n=1 Tax=Beta vulgaris subsp. vulgaris TaxID=3555 RepID=UPI002036F6B3|nr:stress enhanced protein 2, chloroplastic [Beta vulgaris subsp. vulgaris]